MKEVIASTGALIGLFLLAGLFLVALSSRVVWERLAYLELPDLTADSLTTAPALDHTSPPKDDAEAKVRVEELRLAAENQQISQVFQYYKHILRQAQVSFLFSIAAATLGFGVIVVVGIVIPILNPDLRDLKYSGIVSGLIIDAVALLFFSRLNQAQKAMTEFFEKLRLDRRVSDALRLCDTISNGDVRSHLTYDLCLHFAGMTDRNTPLRPPTGMAESRVQESHSRAKGVLRKKSLSR